MRLLHVGRAVGAVFDEANLVSCAGLIPVMGLAERVDLAGLVGGRVSPDMSTGSNAGEKAAAVVAGMCAGADSIDDLDVLRHGGLGRLFTGVYAPSTLGSFLRFFTRGSRPAIGGRRPGSADRARRGDAVAAGRGDADVCGRGFVTAQGLRPRQAGRVVRAREGRRLPRAVAWPVTAGRHDQHGPVGSVIAATRLRGGSAGSSRGAASLITQAIRTAMACGATGRVLVRADSAFGSGAVVSACRKAGVNYSVTLQTNPKLRAAIDAIDETAWTTVRYPGAVHDPDTGGWISDAQVAETTYTAFESSSHKVTARLVVRRVKERNPAPPGQEELFPLWRHHAFLTDTTESTADTDLTHRRHAVIEQVFADLIDGPLAHLPFGRFAANAAWLTLTAMTHNLLRAAGCLTGARYGTARAATIRRHLINVPARLACRARRLTLHLPTRWPWQQAWQTLFDYIQPPPTTA